MQAFFDQELAIRKETGFPPFSRMVNIVFHSRNATAARTCANDFAKQLRTVSGDTAVYGANECPIEKIRESYRFQVLLRSKKASDMLGALSTVVSAFRLPYNVAMDIDVDPVDLL